jgi:hypothetical protein
MKRKIEAIYPLEHTLYNRYKQHICSKHYTPGAHLYIYGMPTHCRL